MSLFNVTVKLTILQGLPGAGKTTWAVKEVQKSSGRTKRVCRDDLLQMTDSRVFGNGNAALADRAARLLAEYYLSHGYNVILDNANFDDEFLVETFDRFIESVAWRLKVRVKWKRFTTPLEICLARDAQRVKPVGEKVIRDMWHRYLRK